MILGSAKGGVILPNKNNISMGLSSAGGGSGFDLTGLKAYYKFCNDPTASNLINQAASIGSSASNGADFSNSSVTSVTGLIDEGYDYDLANGQSVDTGGASTDWEFMYNTSSGVFSFVGWMKPIATGRSSNRIFCDCANIGNETGLGIGEHMVVNREQVFFYLDKDGETDAEWFYSAEGDYPDTTDWRMVFVSFDANGGSDNVQISVNAGTKTTHTSTISGISGASFNPMTFGSARDPPIFETDSIFDEWSFWNRVLTDEEVTTLYNSGAGFAL